MSTTFTDNITTISSTLTTTAGLLETTSNSATTISTSCPGLGSGVAISAGVLAAVAFINASVQTSGWRRRQGLPYVEFTTLLYFFLRFMGDLANVILVVGLGYSAFLYGSNVNTSADSNASLYVFCGTFAIAIAIAFIFKLLHVLNMIREQSSVDVFLIDWEKAGSSVGKGNSVSIWRSVLVANEWNEIQTSRKISTPFQMFGVLFILSIIYRSVSAFAEPGEVGAVTRFAIGGLTYVGLAFVQVLYCKFIHERTFKDQMRDFMDLCSICNVSVFVLLQNNFGYYIHGRSVHGKADVDMSEMNYMIKREMEGLVPRRGLVAGSDVQVFEIMIPHLMRQKIDSIYRSLQQMNIQLPKEKEDDTLKVHDTMKMFLQAFFNHALQDLDYVIKEKLFLEKLFRVNFQEATETAVLTAVGDCTFGDVLYYGNESVLSSFDILLFFLINITTDNFVLAATVAYLVGEILKTLRSEVGSHNLAKKTLIDKMFLI